MPHRKKYRGLMALVFFTGAITLSFQLVFLREFLLTFQGNELIIGVFLSLWMLLTGMGAAFGKFRKVDTISLKGIFLLQALLSLMPLISFTIFHFLKKLLITPGSMPELNHAVLFPIIILSPVCLLSGYLFVLYGMILKEYAEHPVSKIYMLDVLGGIAGGAAVSIFLVLYTDPMIVLVVFILANLLALIILSIYEKIWSTLILSMIIIPISLSFFFYQDASIPLKGNIVKEVNSPHGRITVTRTEDQNNFFMNGTLLFSTAYPNDAEENVHFAMAQHRNPQNVLLISGGSSGMLGEVMKYHPYRIDYIELDPSIVKLAGQYTDHIIRSKNINILQGDARAYLQTTKNRYDVLLLALPEPSSAFLSRYYSVEFFQLCRNRTNRGGVIAAGLPSTQDYMSKEALPLNSVLYNTLSSVFRYVIIIPGGKNYFLASDSILTIRIIQELKQKRIDNLYVNEYYFDEELLKQRNEYIMNTLEKNTEVTRDFRPVVYYYQLSYFMSHFGHSRALYILLVFFVILIIIIKPGKVNLGMMAGGFAASSMELVLIFSLEILYGYVFMVVGLVITIFMAGLALGVYGSKRIKHHTRRSFGVLLIISALISLIISAIIHLLQITTPASPVILFVLTALTFLVSILTGLLFDNASRINQSQPVSKISSVYSADLAGSALGAIAVSVLLLPLLGVHPVCFITAALCALAGISVMWSKSS